MLYPEIPDTFPFRYSQTIGEPFDCFYDVLARKGRARILENFENTDENSKIPSFCLMIIEFSHEDNAIGFMNDEGGRFALLGTESKTAGQLGDAYHIAFHRSPYSGTSGEMRCTVRVGVVVFRITFGLLKLTDQDDPLNLTEDYVQSILHIYKDVTERI